MEDIEDPTDDEYTEEPSEEDSDDTDDDAPEVEVPAPPVRADGAEVESIENLIAKKEERRAGDEDDDSLLNLGREERLEPLAVKVVPPQPTEFVCKNCYLVKHQSQLKDKKRMFCRDCA